MLLAVLVGIGTAEAHVANSTGGITHDLFTPANQPACVYATGNCSWHSFTFASANDLANANRLCAEIYFADYPARAGYMCEVDFVRHCQGSSHAVPYDPLHCDDQDSTFYKAGARNVGAVGTTIRRHVIY